MLDSIFVGMSGLEGYSRGLRVIANNTSNINTPGYKGSTLQFGDLFYNNPSAGGETSSQDANVIGQGVTTYSTSLDFSQGELRQTGNDLDLAVDGQGLFTLVDKEGHTRYSRDGEFKFDDQGYLVNRSTGAKVMGYDEHGSLVQISLNDLRTNPAKATSLVSFRGVLAAGAASNGTYTMTDVTVRDSVGAEHTLQLEFKQQATTSNDNTVRWDVTVKDGTTQVGTGTLLFIGNQIDPTSAKLTVQYAPSGATASAITLDFSQDVTAQATGNQSSMTVTSSDGYGFGTLTQASFDADGVLNLKYSNAQTVKGDKLALARFVSIDNVRAVGDNYFEPVDPSTWETGAAQTGAFGAIRSGVVEISNVDLSSEFSNLVIMQRGYQASSQIVSTANEMLQELFSLRGR